MAVQLNHTIVAAKDKHGSARFLSDVLGLAEPKPWGPFVGVETDNGVTLDFVDADDEIESIHLAFLVSEDEFDAIFDRILTLGLDHWADPFQRRPGEINTNDGGRGVYFPDPSGHLLEILTRPYGSGGRSG
jgi:catechol 2,3-dioxygenase-like lactoylglutathione lyase family enzyme